MQLEREINLNKLAGYRVMLGFNQENFGKLLGITKQSYGQKENGKRDFTDSEKKKLKEYLIKFFPEVSYEELFFN